MIKALTFDLFGTILDLEKSTKGSIIYIINNGKNETVLEIGPGYGNLTKLIVEKKSPIYPDNKH